MYVRFNVYCVLMVFLCLRAVSERYKETYLKYLHCNITSFKQRNMGSKSRAEIAFFWLGIIFSSRCLGHATLRTEATTSVQRLAFF